MMTRIHLLAGLVILLVALWSSLASAEEVAPEIEDPGTAASSPTSQASPGPGPVQPPLPKEAKEGLSIGVVPLGSYNSDIGLGLGAGIALFDYGKGAKPFRNSFFLKFFMTTRYVHYHVFQWDAPRFLGTGFKLRTWLLFRRQLDMAYFGVGNTTVQDEGLVAQEGNEHLYQYTHTTPELRLHVQYELTSWLEVLVGYDFQYVDIVPYSTSLLAEERPFGIDGGVVSLFVLGLVLDTRDHLVTPTEGHWVELSARINAEALGGTSDFAGFTLVSRHYLSPYEGLVVAVRLMADLLVGEVPFYCLNLFGDASVTDGLGGAMSVRGFAANRFIGKIKTVGNLELRHHLLTWHWLGAQFDLGAAAFFDAGRVWKGYAQDGDTWNIHYSGGGGLRLVWNENFLFRFEAGVSEEGARFFVEVFTPF